MIKIKDILASVKSAPAEFPVETAMGLTLSVAAMMRVESMIHRFYPLMFVFMFFVTAITLRKINKIAYYASYLLIWLAYLLFHSGDVIESAWFWVLNIIAGIVLVADLTKSDNSKFANTVIVRIGKVCTAVLLSAIVSAMVSAIIASVMYLFDVEFVHLLMHVNIFIFLTMMPLIYCYLQEHGGEEDNYGSRLIKIIVDFIVSPALVIYTFILLVYVLKILFTMQLPRGGVAYMVSIYIGLVLVGNLLNKLVKDSHFNWFYDNFLYIAIAPIVLLWIGTIYRINQYGLTEWRVYLLIVNVLMTLFPLMLKVPRTSRYNLLTITLMVTMVAFTCIPPVSAHSIGVRSQYARFLQHADELNAIDSQTGKFVKYFDYEAIAADSTLKAKYDVLDDEISYLTCKDTILAKYGSWGFDKYRLRHNTFDKADRIVGYEITEYAQKVSLGEFCNRYTVYNASYSDGVLNVMLGDNKVVLEYHIQDSIDAHPDWLRTDPLRFLVYHNDSVMVVLDGIEVTDSTHVCSPIYDYRLEVYGK